MYYKSYCILVSCLKISFDFEAFKLFLEARFGSSFSLLLFSRPSFRCEVLAAPGPRVLMVDIEDLDAPI